MSALNGILVPTDFSKAAFSALEYGIYIANRRNREVYLLHVVSKSKLRENISVAANYKERIYALEKRLNTLKNNSGGAFRISTHLIVSDKPVHEEIIAFGNKYQAGLCCIGTFGTAYSASKHRIGSNTAKVVSEALFPVATSYVTHHPIQFKNLLLPIDLTRHTQEKVQRIIYFAKDFDAKIFLLATSEFLEELTTSDDKLEERLEEAASQIRSEGLRCSTEIIRHDAVSKSVTGYAKEIEADLIVIMASNQSWFSQWLRGSRTNKVITHSDIPVLSFRPQED
ncbi:MAG: universal stress protein [Chitinophagales bacterium]